MSKKMNSLGKSLVRDHKKKRTFVNKDGFRHTSDLPDGFDWARLNLHSVTEQSSVDDFLDQVKLAENEYSKEFSNVQILNPVAALDILTEDERKERIKVRDIQNQLLSIPRRPAWQNLSKEELDAGEKENFLNWRRNLAQLKEDKDIAITPYEKNLEVWRQLWRVIERSEVILQIIDARNPLLFRCEDLEQYVKELDQRKRNVLLLNKADLLSEAQRKMWASYFESVGVKVLFFSALQQMQNEESDNDKIARSKTEDPALDQLYEDSENEDEDSAGNDDSDEEKMEFTSTNQENEPVEPMPVGTDSNVATDNVVDDKKISNSSDVINRLELTAILKSLGDPALRREGVATIGLVGYPNVGKSSTINAVLLNKKVKVSSTPGKTKHFQTMMVEPDLCFCDCPGLVFPKFVVTKADMVTNGILPIDQLTEHVGPMTLLMQLIPPAVLEATYHILIPKTDEDTDASAIPTAENFLNAYGYQRGFMTQRGLPDHARSSRYILKDFVNGRLLYCHPPPGVEDEDYRRHSIQAIPDAPSRVFLCPKSATKSENVDKGFFSKTFSKAHVKGQQNRNGPSTDSVEGKPWKKHHNRNKKEKLRRIYSHIDQ